MKKCFNSLAVLGYVTFSVINILSEINSKLIIWSSQMGKCRLGHPNGLKVVSVCVRKCFCYSCKFNNTRSSFEVFQAYCTLQQQVNIEVCIYTAINHLCRCLRKQTSLLQQVQKVTTVECDWWILIHLFRFPFSMVQGTYSNYY